MLNESLIGRWGEKLEGTRQVSEFPLYHDTEIYVSNENVREYTVKELLSLCGVAHVSHVREFREG